MFVWTSVLHNQLIYINFNVFVNEETICVQTLHVKVVGDISDSVLTL